MTSHSSSIRQCAKFGAYITVTLLVAEMQQRSIRFFTGILFYSILFRRYARLRERPKTAPFSPGSTWNRSDPFYGRFSYPNKPGASSTKQGFCFLFCRPQASIRTVPGLTELLYAVKFSWARGPNEMETFFRQLHILGPVFPQQINLPLI